MSCQALTAPCSVTNPPYPRYDATCPVCQCHAQLFYDRCGVLCASTCEHYREMRAYESTEPHMVFAKPYDNIRSFCKTGM